MDKINYQIKCDEILKNNIGKSVLLHSCCAPCSSYCIEYLSKYMNITVFYYNPNIEPFDEYLKRKEEQKRLISELKTDYKVDFMDCDYDNELYKKIISGLEKEPEGGSRCLKCYNLRLEATAIKAKENNFDFFCTTLTVSPYKNSQILNKIGEELENKYNINYLYSDFKKKEGYKRSIMLSKEYNLYRQDYCGCIYSKRENLNE